MIFRATTVDDVNLRTLSRRYRWTFARLRTGNYACNVHCMGTRDDKEAGKIDFETAMTDLEALVERLEHGDLPLEESLAAFERGMLLTRTCQAALKEAEQKVEVLLKQAGGQSIQDFGLEEPA